MVGAQTIWTRLLAGAPPAAPSGDLATFLRAHEERTRDVPRALERALLGGFHADRLGFAFAAGYRAALARLLGADDDRGAACLAATEEGGGHPKAIRTRLEREADGGVRLVGEKRWSTLAGEAETLLVVASEGFSPEGQNRLRVVRVPASTPGLTLRRMPDAPFAPEIPHYELSLDVHLPADAVLPGDGYARYLKPFRTQEDLGVLAAWAGYAIGAARRHGLGLVERTTALALTVLALGEEAPDAATTHVALAGVLDDARRLHEYLKGAWGRVGGEEAARWERDAPLLLVAEAARKARLARAWERLAAER